MLAAAHEADLAAAAEAGLATAFIARPLEHGPNARSVPSEGVWDLAGTSITEIAELLA
jgi:2-haloacid dehalogenase